MKKLPQIKKNIKAFLSSEEGKISQKNVSKMGLGLAVLGLMVGRTVLADHNSYFRNVSCFGIWQAQLP